jgi:cyclin D5
LQLLAVACLSLAIKMEEQHAPRLSEFRVDAYEFDSASILRMELFVLSTLEWRMNAVTPFSYISCFAARFREDERRTILLRAVECVFAAIKGSSFPLSPMHFLPFHGVRSRSQLIFCPRPFAAMSSVEYQPSTMAVASILVARGRNLDALKAILGSSCPQLDTVSPSCRPPCPSVVFSSPFRGEAVGGKRNDE